MTLDPKAIAEDINEAIGATDKDGKPIEVTEEMQTYAKAIVNTLQASIYNHLLVTGVTAAGSPLVAGAASAGIFALVPSAVWLSTMQSGFTESDPASLSIDAVGSTGYIQSVGKVNFLAGNITGNCTSTAEASGPLVAGAGTDGTVDALMGPAWATIVLPPLGDAALAAKIYNAIIKRIEEDGEALYATGTVTGVCPSGSGPLAGGLGVGGTVT